MENMQLFLKIAAFLKKIESLQSSDFLYFL